MVWNDMINVLAVLMFHAKLSLSDELRVSDSPAMVTDSVLCFGMYEKIV